MPLVVYQRSHQYTNITLQSYSNDDRKLAAMPCRCRSWMSIQVSSPKSSYSCIWTQRKRQPELYGDSGLSCMPSGSGYRCRTGSTRRGAYSLSSFSPTCRLGAR